MKKFAIQSLKLKMWAINTILYVRSEKFLCDQVLDQMRNNTLFWVQLGTIYCYLYTNISPTMSRHVQVLFYCAHQIFFLPLLTENDSLKSAIDYFTSSEAGYRYFLVDLPHKRLPQPNFITVISNFRHSPFRIR